MKIKKISIFGFGQFRDYELELQPGLNLLWGSNEAGKSTLLAFLRAMLFGFEHKNNLEARYETKDGGRYGGELWLETKRGNMRLRRIGGRKASGEFSVWDHEGKPLPESELSLALGGISKELFFQVFGFGLDELMSFEKLAATGEASEALFAAGMQGARFLPRANATLAKISSDLFKPNGKNGVLNQRIEEILEVRERIQQLGLRPQEYFGAVEQLQRLEAQLAPLEVEIGQAERQQIEWKRTLAISEDILSWKVARTELESLPDLAEFPLEAEERVKKLVQRRSQLNLEFEDVNARLQRTNESRIELQNQTAGAELWPWVEAACEKYRLVRERIGEIPIRRATLEVEKSQLASKLHEFRFPWNASKLDELDFGTKARNELSEIEDAWNLNSRNLGISENEIRQLEYQSEQLGSDFNRQNSELAELPAITASQARENLRDFNRFLDAQREHSKVSSLWEETNSTLSKLRLLEEELPRPAFPRSLFLSAMVLLASFAAWTVWHHGFHPSSEALQASMVASVLVVAMYWRSSSHFRGLEARRALRQESYRLEESRSIRYAQALKAEEEVLAKQIAKDAQRFDILVGGGEASVRSKYASLEQLVFDAEKRDALQSAVQQLKLEKDNAHRASLEAHRRKKELEKERDVLQTRLNVLASERGLEMGLSPAQVTKSWTVLTELRHQFFNLKRLEELDALEINKLQEVDACLLEVVLRLGVAEDGQTREERVASIEAWKRDQAEKKTALRLLNENAQQLEVLGFQHDRELKQIQTELGELLQRGKSQDPESFLARAHEARAWKQAWVSVRETDLRIHAAMGLSAERAWATFNDLGGTYGISQRVKSSEELLSRLKKQREETLKECGALKNQIKVWATDSSLSELRHEEETLKSQLAYGARRYLVARLTAELMARARHRMDEEEQPKVLARASEMFHELTGGRYTRVFVPWGEGRELCILDGKQTRWTAHALSRGTREQLYLAFRLAVVEDFAQRQVSLPVILDDVLVNFDDVRTEQAISLLKSMSTQHQIIAFTCHPGQKEYFDKKGASVSEIKAAHRAFLSARSNECQTPLL